MWRERSERVSFARRCRARVRAHACTWALAKRIFIFLVLNIKCVPPSVPRCVSRCVSLAVSRTTRKPRWEGHLRVPLAVPLAVPRCVLQAVSLAADGGGRPSAASSWAAVGGRQRTAATRPGGCARGGSGRKAQCGGAAACGNAHAVGAARVRSCPAAVVAVIAVTPVLAARRRRRMRIARNGYANASPMLA